MKTTRKTQLKALGATVVATLVVALTAPAARAQTAEELQQLKESVQQMQKTIDSLNKKIGELEKAQAARPAPPPVVVVRSAMETNSASIQTIEKIAGGRAEPHHLSWGIE